MKKGTLSSTVDKRHTPVRGYALFGAVVVAVAAALGALGWAGSRLPPPEARIRGSELEFAHYPLWRRASDWIAGRKYVLLTFDDGPYGQGVDERIFPILSAHGAHAIFFEVCSHVTADSADIPRRVITSGNVLGNHSYDHSNLKRLSGPALAHQLRDCSHLLETVSGVRPRFFRPPWGKTSAAVVQEANRSGMRQVLWNTNSGDTWLKTPQEIVELTLGELELGGNGSILLMHSKPATAAALDDILGELQRRGFVFVIPGNDEHVVGDTTARIHR